MPVFSEKFMGVEADIACVCMCVCRPLQIMDGWMDEWTESEKDNSLIHVNCPHFAIYAK
jgi:hypothetical protein